MQKTYYYRPVDLHEAYRIRGRPAAAASFLKFVPVFLLVFLLLTACATTLPMDVQRPPSTAFLDYETTSTAKLFEEAALRHPGKSGFALIRKGRPAFTGRIAMTVMAEKSLDLQYYMWEPDTTGRILALRLVEAADRGVRVRILVDDNTLAGKGLAHRFHRCASKYRDPHLQPVSPPRFPYLRLHYGL
jgi:hypothetical protein